MEETLKKMGIILEKIATKVDELDKRLKMLETKVAQLEMETPPPLPKEEVKGKEEGGVGTTPPGTPSSSTISKPELSPTSSTSKFSSSQFTGSGVGTGTSTPGAGAVSHHATSSPSPLAVGGSSFLGSLLGSFAGMGLFKTLFDKDVSASDVAKESGSEGGEDISSKLDEINSKLDQLSQNIEEEELDPETDLEGILDDIEDFSDEISGEEDWDSGADDWGGDLGGDF
jgi:outer membrane murein-binding lipoprotein Lpp